MSNRSKIEEQLALIAVQLLENRNQSEHLLAKLRDLKRLHEEQQLPKSSKLKRQTKSVDIDSSEEYLSDPISPHVTSLLPLTTQRQTAQLPKKQRVSSPALFKTFEEEVQRLHPEDSLTLENTTMSAGKANTQALQSYSPLTPPPSNYQTIAYQHQPVTSPYTQSTATQQYEKPRLYAANLR